jgi:hypothetical protein
MFYCQFPLIFAKWFFQSRANFAIQKKLTAKNATLKERGKRTRSLKGVLCALCELGGSKDLPDINLRKP